jgi:SpoIID/LytB domain protein
LFDIIPLRRGRSGRLKEIELIGSLKNYRIRGELNIRETLSQDYLESSCFILEKELDEIGTPISFTFVGAGQGHGVGMCKTGAAIMAAEGHNWRDILQHYFENCNIDSIYEDKK